MTYAEIPSRFVVGKWAVDRETGEIFDGKSLDRLEPKTMDLLVLLATAPGQVFSREHVMAELWPDVVVADDALARTLFKLRRALGDDARSAQYVETLHKRGYRLIANVRTANEDATSEAQGVADMAGNSQPARSGHRAAPRRVAIWALAIALFVLGGWLIRTQLHHADVPPDPDRALIERADDFYYQYSRADNEAAIELYERILVREPDRAEALRGLANALTQRMIRWSQDPRNSAQEFTTLTASLQNGHLREPAARQTLERAELLARRSVAVDPSDSLNHRALGLVLATQSRFDEAIAECRAAIAIDADAWGAMINLSEALELTGRSDDALAALIDAHAAMTRRYSRDKQHVLPYYADLAVLIGDRFRRSGRNADAEAWYRRALVHAPLHPSATVALADVLVASGRRAEAEALCVALNSRVSVQPDCAKLLATEHPAGTSKSQDDPDG